MKMIGIYTAAGKQLAARAQAEGLSLQITRAVSGSTLSAQNGNVMARERQTLSIGSKTAKDGKCTVSAVLNASEATSMYSLREVGLYAKLADEAEVLYKVFQLNESLTVEPGTDLVLTFYLAETILAADQVEITVTSQGLVTQEICTQTAQDAAQRVREELNTHVDDTGAHNDLFAAKAPLSHTHSAANITAGMLGGIVVANSNTAYATAQVRSIVLSSNEPSGGSNGQVWIKYTA